MSSHDWSRFLLRIPIAADKQKILECWTSQSALESWFLRKAQFSKNGKPKSPDSRIELNDEYEWMWHGYPDDVVEKGKVLELTGEHLKFSFGKAGNVSVSVKNEQGENILELMQDEIPTDEESKAYYHMGCSNGWTYHLTNLKSLLEGGIDLRNRNVELKNVLNS